MFHIRHSPRIETSFRPVLGRGSCSTVQGIPRRTSYGYSRYTLKSQLQYGRAHVHLRCNQLAQGRFSHHTQTIQSLLCQSLDPPHNFLPMRPNLRRFRSPIPFRVFLSARRISLRSLNACFSTVIFSSPISRTTRLNMVPMNFGTQV